MNFFVAAKPGYVKLTDDREALPGDARRVIALELTLRDVGWLALALNEASLEVDVDLDLKAIA
jgi:hypothetical protein